MTRRAAASGVVLLGVLWAAIGVQTRGPVPAAGEGAPALPVRLDETGLFVPGSPRTVDPANRPFVPQYPLWSDGLTKKRWVYLPPGAVIDAADLAEWRFPVGTRFWKEFSLGGRPVETRVVWKAAPETWVFGTYAWNAEGTEAMLAADDGVRTDVEVRPGRPHTIPSKSDCTACHGTRREAPLGFNALQLSPDRDPDAIHGEPLPVSALTLQTLIEDARLGGVGREVLADPPRIRTADPGTRSVLGYFAANCAMCHDGSGDISAAGPTVRLHDLLEDGDAVAARMAGVPTRWQIPGLPDGDTMVLAPGAPERSDVLARMRSRSPSSQMPPLGSVVRDERAVEALSRWIAGSAHR